MHEARQAAQFIVCPSEKLGNGQHLKLALVFEGHDDECLIVRFDGQVYAYINRCVHMPRRLDCEASQVFDHSGRYLRCSMHGIVYTPQSGASVSTMCEGERLRAIDILEENGQISLADFRVSAIREALACHPRI